MREKFWELAGTKLGNLLNIKKVEVEEEKETAIFNKMGEVDYKS